MKPLKDPTHKGELVRTPWIASLSIPRIGSGVISAIQMPVETKMNFSMNSKRPKKPTQSELVWHNMSFRGNILRFIRFVKMILPKTYEQTVVVVFVFM